MLAPPQSQGGTRAFAQAILFGPGGDLFVPITNLGELRRCETTSKFCKVIVEAGGALLAPFYLLFEHSDAATLDFEGH